MSEQGKQVAKVAALITGGAIIGAGIGLLYAPKSGAETRREVSRYARKAQVQATRWGRSLQSGVKEVLDRKRVSFKNQHEEMKPELQAALN
jgi:gas vesicle protein